MTANPTVVNTNEFFCVPVGKSRQAAIFLGNLVKNAIEEGKRIPKRIEMSSDLGGSRTSASPLFMHTLRTILPRAAG